MPPRKRYGRLAAHTYQALIDPLLWVLRPRLVHICDVLGASSILDIACATGAQCRAFGRAGLQATGIDLSAAMIDAAARRGGPNVRYVQGSAYDLPFPDGAFDAAVLSLALHEHTEAERTRMVAEADRVVRPAGHLILADYTRPHPASWHLPWHIIRAVEAIAGPEHHAGFLDFVAQGSLRGLLERYGLCAESIGHSHFGAIGIAVCAVSEAT